MTDREARSATSHRRVTSRERLSLFVLLSMTVIGVGLCALIVRPFVPGLAWALALAVVAYPMHQWILRHWNRPHLAAGATVLIVLLVLLLPAMFLVWQIGKQATGRFEQVQEQLESGSVRKMLDRVPLAGKAYDWLTGHSGAAPTADDIAPAVQRRAGAWLQTIIWSVVQIVLALFTLFFLLRDKREVLAVMRSLMPLSNDESAYFFERIRSMAHATIYGTVFVSIVQGALGGLIFALVGVPGALLWGVAMAVLSIIPTSGAFVIWLPVAIVLGVQGQWGKAAIIGLWGALVVGTIDNVLYPVLVGKEMRLHTLPVLLAILGGVSTFGAAGIVLGPVILAGTIALLDIIKRRTAHGRQAEAPR
jgi:predicted PurR-regulated permease PerM